MVLHLCQGVLSSCIASQCIGTKGVLDVLSSSTDAVASYSS